jgi:uncharacterized coiled-coil DUF342 family protein
LDQSPDFKTKATARLNSSPNRSTISRNSRPEDKWKTVLVDLNGAIDEYEGKAFDIIHEHEKDFINAYSGHMDKVYREMDELRKKANENEF